MGQLFKRTVTKGGNNRKTTTMNRRTGKVSTSYSKVKPKSTSSTKKRK